MEDTSNRNRAHANMDLNRINQLLSVYRDGLLDDTLPFWLKH